MDRFSILLTGSAARDLDRVPAEQRERVVSEIRKLEASPFPSGARKKKLRGLRPALFRLRAGDFRVLYRIEGRSVTVMRIIARKDLEKIIKSLTGF